VDRTEAVVAIDALARRGRFPPKHLLELRTAPARRPRRGSTG
jgi:hypothetical protein